MNENNEDINKDNDNNIQYSHYNTENNVQRSCDFNKTDEFKSKKFKNLRINSEENINNEINKNHNKFLKTDVGFYSRNVINPLKSRTTNNSSNKKKRVKLVKVYIESK